MRERAAAVKESPMRTTLCGCLTVMLCCLVVAGCRPRTQAVKVGVSKPEPNQPMKVANDKDKGGTDKKSTSKQDKGKDKTPQAVVDMKFPPNTKMLFAKGYGAWEPANNDDKDAAEKQSLVASEKQAKDNARVAVVNYLRNQDPPILWEPELDYVYKNFMRGKGEPKRSPTDDDTVENKNMLCWLWPIAITPQQLDEMRREDAHFRVAVAVKERTAIAETRMLELSRFVGWAVLALLGVCGFIRLEEWSRGTKQRRWLRVALASLLCVGGVGWWLLS
jgi:hypothetical protein